MTNDRIVALQKQFTQLELDGYIVDLPINIFYLTGLQLSLGTLFLTKQEAYLIVDGRYFEACQQTPGLTVILRKEGSLKNLIIESHNKNHFKAIGFDKENTTYQNYLAVKKDIEEVSSTIELKACHDIVKKQRAIKDKNELNLLRQAADLGSQGYECVLKNLKEGISEVEVANELEIFWKRKGSQGVAFEPIIAFGPNSAIPHHRAGKSVLKSGDIVLVDIGVKYQHYHSDMTRVVFFKNANQKLLDIYKIVLEAQEAALKFCKPGVSTKALDLAAREVLDRAGLLKNFTHSLGHGVGLDVHELPGIRPAVLNEESILEEGMVITIEPGVYIPKFGGVRIEDTVIITKKGCENLSTPSKAPLVLS